MSVVYVPQEPTKVVVGKDHRKPGETLSEEAYGNRRVTTTPTGRLVRMMDLTPALDYGDIHILFPPGMLNMPLEDQISHLQTGLDAFNDEDHLVAIGPPVLLMLAGIIAANKNEGRVSVLQWDKFTRSYKRVRFDAHKGVTL